MKIACLLAEGFEDAEFQQPYEAFRKAGHEVVVIGLKSGEQIEGERGKVKARVEKTVSQVSPQQFDALLIPGGYSPDKLRAEKPMVDFTRDFVDLGRPVFAICHGPQLLLAADRYKDRVMTAWTTVRDDLQKAGGTVKDQPVVVHGNLVTSRKPDDLPQFIAESMRILAGLTHRQVA